MRGVNKAILIGTLGKDPEVRYLGNGSAVGNVSIATSESWKDKNTGQTQEQTEWHRIVFYGRLAEVVGEFARKGSRIYVEGSIHTRKWQDKTTGQDRYSTEVKASAMQLLDGKPAASDGEPHQGQYYRDEDAQPSVRNQGKASQQKAPQQRQAAVAGGFAAPADEFDDDIPF